MKYGYAQKHTPRSPESQSNICCFKRLLVTRKTSLSQNQSW